MKPWKMGALVALALLSAGCSGCTLKAPAATTAASATAVDEKVVLAAEVAYGAVLDTVIAGAEDGRIAGKDAETMTAIVSQAKAVRPLLHTALKTANQTELLAQLNGLKELTAQLRALAAVNPPHKD